MARSASYGFSAVLANSLTRADNPGCGTNAWARHEHLAHRICLTCSHRFSETILGDVGDQVRQCLPKSRTAHLSFEQFQLQEVRRGFPYPAALGW